MFAAFLTNFTNKSGGNTENCVLMFAAFLTNFTNKSGGNTENCVLYDGRENGTYVFASAYDALLD